MAKASLLFSIISFLALGFVCLQIYQGTYQGGIDAVFWGGLWALFGLSATVLAFIAIRKSPHSRLAALIALLIAWLPIGFLALGAFIFGQ